MKTALLFPGQGSQRVGMGKQLAERFAAARRTFAEADEALGFAISALCFEGPADRLQLTEFTQPAILTTSIAALRALAGECELEFDLVAGHSLGEWSALVAAGALSLGDAVRLVHLRGRAMQAAVPAGQGAMAAILGLTPEVVAQVCQQVAGEEVCAPANLNGAGQVVISGHTAAVERAMAAARDAGASRAVKLPVSAPFHCALMRPAAEKVAAALESIEITGLKVPVVTNVDAQPNRDPGRVKRLLVEQVTAPVRWEESVQRLAAEGVTRGLELGPGNVLAGLVKRTARQIGVAAVAEPADVEALCAAAAAQQAS